MIEKLTKQFIARYSKDFAALNKNVYPAVEDTGSFEVPIVEVGSGGGTAFVGTDTFDLNPAAKVQIKFKRMLPYRAIYRIAIPRNEVEIAANKPEYFNYLFDRVMSKAVGNFKATWGDENTVRFGKTFCSYDNLQGTIFTDGDDFIELRLNGHWASEKEEGT